MVKAKYVQVALGLPVDKTFIYSIPENLQKVIKIGQRIEVPFGQRVKIGYIVGWLNKTVIKDVKPIGNILDQEPLLDKQMLQLTRKVADYYCASWGEVIEAATPANIRKRRRKIKENGQLLLHSQNLRLGAQEEKFSLSPQQRQVLNLIKKSIEKRRHEIFLLYGITASGKTEVYLQAIASVLAQGKSSIVLVPEISLTPQTVERFRSRFGKKVALMHSRLLARQKTAYWQMIRKGQAQIVIGPRSAIFAPVKDLGLIVIDEEHETAYKQQDTTPRYHAREVAIMRARLTQSTVILGSATPSLESFYNACKGRFKLLCLPARVTKRNLPQVEIVDMRKEITLRRRRVNIFSRTLEAEMRQVMQNKEQAILFLNRRGFATFISCTKCGYVAKCKRCNVSLTHHYATKKLNCHYCNYQVEPPQICPQCNSNYLNYFGLGTEKVESEMHRLFPQAQIARLDTDVTVKRNAHVKILNDFKTGKIDILIGTQMVAKGLDFPRVSLVGVISADTALNLPDFRSGERTFNLLTQVAGRAGRGQCEGKVVIQTYVPAHYAIVASTTHDYFQFYKREIKSRRALKLPPYIHLVILTLRGRSQKKVEEIADDLSANLKKKKASKSIQILGPAPDVVSRVRGNYRWNVMLKGSSGQRLVQLLRKTIDDFRRYKGAILSIDVDPL
jgi:primosomal protein N' (replication factor Y)